MPEDESSPDQQRLYNMLDRRIARLARDGWLNGVGTARAKVGLGPQRGATDAIILKATITVDVHVKFSTDDAQREIDGYTVLEAADPYRGHILSPLFKDILRDDPAGGILMLAPYEEDAPTFSDYLLRTDSRHDALLAYYEAFLEASKQVWWSTPIQPSLSKQEMREHYMRRIRERAPALATALGLKNRQEFQRLRVEINGVDHGVFSEAFRSLGERLDALAPVTPCTTHGDENASNLLVDAEAYDLGRISGWLLVDYVNATPRNDWVMSVAKMLNDWEFDHGLRSIRSLAHLGADLKATSMIDGDVLHLEYNVEAMRSLLPPLATTLASRVRSVAEETATRIGDLEWRERLRLARFATAIGSAALRYSREPQALPVIFDSAFAAFEEAAPADVIVDR